MTGVLQAPCDEFAWCAADALLSIQLIKLENLPPKGRDGVYDVIVRLCILPADKQAKTSKILRGSLSPLAEEDFSFRVKEPVGKAVRFSVFNALLQGKHDAIGHALFNIEDLEPSFGSLQVYLQLSQERLIVDTIQARNLSVSHIFKGARSAEKFNTYIKITFYCAGQKGIERP
ncbi:Uncharacterized protein GBIM_14230 [Gryllus bimaculatus]|nr:Uncharacterized protein GBIM_14230 [Gryllus bimaculatus]